MFTGPAFPSQKSAGNFPCRVEFFFILHSQRKKIDSFLCLFAGNRRGQCHGIAIADQHCAIRLFGNFSGFHNQRSSLEFKPEFLFRHTSYLIFIYILSGSILPYLL